MILAVLIDKVQVYSDDKVKIEFGITAKQFLDLAESVDNRVS